MRQLPRGSRFLLTNPAIAVELPTGLDHQFADHDIALDSPAGNDLQPSGRNAALESAADVEALGFDFTFDPALLANGDFRLGADRALDMAVDVQVIAQGEVADKLCTCCNNGVSGTFAAVRTISVKDSH
jgi:hypothetical protein